jgi:hypothetical protein
LIHSGERAVIGEDVIAEELALDGSGFGKVVLGGSR